MTNREKDMQSRATFFASSLLVLSSLLIWSGATSAQTSDAVKSGTIPPELISRSDIYHQVTLSPDGKHIAVVVSQAEKRILMIFSTVGFKLVSNYYFTQRDQVGLVDWVNNERLIIQMAKSLPWSEELLFTGELIGVNFDGKKERVLYGYRVPGTMDKYAKQRTINGRAEIVDLLKGDDRHILIASTEYYAGKAKFAKLFKLNVYSGDMRKAHVKSPVHNARFITDQQQNVRFVSGLDDDYTTSNYWYTDKEWVKLENAGQRTRFQPLMFDKTGEWLYVLDNADSDKTGLYKISSKTGERKRVFVDTEVDVTNVILKADRSSIYALRVDDQYPAHIIVNKNEPEAQLFKLLLQSFPGKEVRLTSRSDDGNLSVVAVRSDVMPASFYLYNAKTNRIIPLFDNYNGIAPELMSPAEPITFKARDGLTVHGYLSRPTGVPESQPLPAVVLVHGGPHNVRDYWLYDRNVQFLTSQGYAVLRVNYRGSGGYGRAFETAGYEHWGDTMQYDIIDGTKWLIDKQSIIKDRICIMGASFGGYSAVQSATIEPDLFKCVVANAGIYDLNLMLEEGDILKSTWGESFLTMVLGNDKQQRAAFSPVNRVHLLKANLLLAHGERDERAPYEHAKRLTEALEKHKKPYQMFIRDKEAHGFSSDKNRAEYYVTVAEFLAKHLN